MLILEFTLLFLADLVCRFKERRLLAEKIAYRSAKALLVYLALAHNHMSFRSQIAQQIWPEADQAHWQERLYQATRVIRKEVQGD